MPYTTRLLLVIILSILGLSAYAQPDLSPWTAKFIVTHPNGVDSDTVRFGCDTAGGQGYQPGLDIIDTNFSDRIRILAYDEKVEADSGFGTCVNLSWDIKEFHENGPVRFTAYILSDSSNGDHHALLNWDIDELYFRNDSFKLTGLNIQSTYGYIEFIDGTDYGVCGHFVGDTTIICDSAAIAIISDGVAPECNNSAFVVRLDISVWFNQYFTGIDRISRVTLPRFTVFPNPTYGILNIKWDKVINGSLEIYNTKGQLTFSEAIRGASGLVTDLRHLNLPSGMYVAIGRDSNNNILGTQTFIFSN